MKTGKCICSPELQESAQLEIVASFTKSFHEINKPCEGYVKAPENTLKTFAGLCRQKPNIGNRISSSGVQLAKISW
jgi:hypothetical protein